MDRDCNLTLGDLKAAGQKFESFLQIDLLHLKVAVASDTAGQPASPCNKLQKILQLRVLTVFNIENFPALRLSYFLLYQVTAMAEHSYMTIGVKEVFSAKSNSPAWQDLVQSCTACSTSNQSELVKPR